APIFHKGGLVIVKVFKQQFNRPLHYIDNDSTADIDTRVDPDDKFFTVRVVKTTTLTEEKPKATFH
ncbi:MAG: hypothetical protein VW270_27350, partial [Candidatus Poseidoniales archaeon]